MADKEPAKFPHLLLKDSTVTEPYTSTITRGPGFKFPTRNRQDHGAFLKAQLEHLKEEEYALEQQRVAFGIDAGKGICLQFESEPGFLLKLESLESLPSHVELLSSKEIEGKMYATVLVPEGKLAHFVKRVEKYLTEETPKEQPKYQPMIDSIAAIRRAALDALWTDDKEVFPLDNQAIWWEVWLRREGDETALLSYFKEHAAKIGLRFGSEHITFPDRSVVLAYGTKEQMSKSVDLLNCVAELRKAKETAEIFTRMSPFEQAEWVEDTLGRLQSLPENAPAVCILDTGVNNGHPLIEPRLDSRDMHAYDPGWNVEDHLGHGTEMAGLALYGDLTPVLLSRGPIQLPYVLESVKILPPAGKNDHHLYGHVTAESIGRVEITAPQRQRTACMAVTTRDFRDRGKPSSWSATVDNLCSGADDDTRRLFVISAGNTSGSMRHLYPNVNLTDGVHDPGQSWNALTIGAFTEKALVDQQEYPGWAPIAPPGDLSPSSCTSNTWANQWPFKPDIVLEGGNMALNPVSKAAEPIDSLQLLSTYFEPLAKKFSTSGDTSAASALASRMAATIQAYYPDLWPETIRALLVHSADWTNAMKARFTSSTPRGNIEGLLRYCGYGVPDLDKAMWSAGNSLTLIIQDSLQPFDYNKKTKLYKTRDMHLHKIPWPKEALLELGETMVEMRVTLSYFIEPNPANRGWTGRYRYASHQLRFEVRTPEETDDQFRKRINKAARDEEEGKTSESDTKYWDLGRLRNRGSVHSDRWTGTATALASRGLIAIFPVIGWWRERHQLGKWNKQARYALVVSIRTPETELNIYTEVANKLKVPIKIEI
jgi:Subtilase family